VLPTCISPPLLCLKELAGRSYLGKREEEKYLSCHLSRAHTHRLTQAFTGALLTLLISVLQKGLQLESFVLLSENTCPGKLSAT